MILEAALVGVMINSRLNRGIVEIGYSTAEFT
jgi:hypothetical protein